MNFGTRSAGDTVEHVRSRMRGMPNARRSLRWREDEVLAYADDSETEAIRAAADFEHEGFRLQDFWEVDCRKYTVNSSQRSLYAISYRRSVSTTARSRPRNRKPLRTGERPDG